ncbi:unnamed protein product [Arabidopsis halleri]
MLPGMMPKGHEEQSKAKVKRYMTMMDSMTNEELDSSNPKLFNQPRMMRIARGAGRVVKEVTEMLEEYKRMVKTSSQMGKGLKQFGGMKGLQKLMKQMGSRQDMMGMFDK